MATKVVIYWDIDTCFSNNFQLVLKNIRDLCISRNNFIEESFTCFTIQSFESKDDIESQFNIKCLQLKDGLKYVQIPHEIDFELSHKSSLVLITADKQLIECLICKQYLNPIVLIYGTNIDIQSIQFTPNYMCFPFNYFENFCQNYSFVVNSFSNLSVSGQPSDNRCQTIETENRNLTDQEIFDLKNLIGVFADLKQCWTSIKEYALNLFEKTNQNWDQIPKEIDSKMVNPKKNKKKKTFQQKFIPGVCGLINLGNTCYMNSALQCLSNIKILTEFAKQYNCNIRSNIKSHLITIYSDLIRTLWSANRDSISPKAFKTRIGQICHQFSGFRQNDCSELLNVVLNQFHEELITNPKQKTDSNPYKTFDSYLKDNNTFIAQNFQGFQKFRLFCECGHTQNESYDPFYIISLPQIGRTFPIVLVTDDNLFRIEIKCEKTFISVSNLLEEVVNSFNSLDKNRLIAVLLKDHKIEFIYDNFNDINLDQLNGDIYIYVRDTPQMNIFVILNDCQPFGIPLLLNVCETNYNSIIDHFFAKIKPNLNDVDDEDVCNLMTTHFSQYSNGLAYESCFGVMADHQLWDNTILITQPIGQKIRQKYREKKIIRRQPLYETSDNKLENVLIQHLSEHQLSEQMFCNNCQKNTNIYQKLDILYSPNILMIQLKSNPNSQNYSESYSCQFPLVLNFADYVSDNTQNKRDLTYDLVAVSNYYGSGTFGHYTAYANNCLNNKWYKFNDSSVDEINETQLNSSNAYLLFYVKR